jgi:hypothetical protein
MAMNEMKAGNYTKAIGLLNRIIDDNYRMNGKDMTQVDAKYVPAAASKIRLFAPC